MSIGKILYYKGYYYSPTIIVDSGRGITVTFVTSIPQDDPPHPSDTKSSASHSTMLSRVKATREQVENKKVIVDKLGKIWTVLTALDSVGEKVKDVGRP